jgi:hypothetical protein
VIWGMVITSNCRWQSMAVMLVFGVAVVPLPVPSLAPVPILPAVTLLRVPFVLLAFCLLGS